MNYLIVFLGAGVGGAARFGVGQLVLRLPVFTTFPVATFSVNIVGSLLMGLFAGYFFSRSGDATGWKLFLTTGLMGGFTTFSAFSLETILFIERGEWGLAFFYILASVLLGALALFAGLSVMRLV